MFWNEVETTWAENDVMIFTLRGVIQETTKPGSLKIFSVVSPPMAKLLLLQDIIVWYCCRHPKGGSFVRPKKVDFGIGIIEALKQRYGQGSDSINQEDMYVMSGKHKKKAIEMVGADSIQEKQRYSVIYHLETLKISMCYDI